MASSDWRSDLVTAYRDHGLTVHIPTSYNWRTFGVADWASDDRPHAALKHQFMWPAENSDQGAVDMLTKGYDTGRYFLNPPVANNFLGKSDKGDVYMIAGRVAQHGGRGVRSVYERAIKDIPPIGDGQNAPGPDDWDGASFVYWGTECHHYWKEPFHQYDALVRMSVAESEVFNWSAQRILEHSNSSGRKYEDMIAVDGNRMRRDIADILAGRAERPPPSTDWWDTVNASEAEALIRRVVGSELDARGVSKALPSDVSGGTATLGRFVLWSDAKLWLMQQDLWKLLAAAKLPRTVLPAKPAPKPPVVVRPTQHTVVKGETLTTIAGKYQVTVPALLKANPEITNPDNIGLGDVLVIPPKA